MLTKFILPQASPSFSQKKLTIFLSVLVVLTGLTYINRFPTGDDAWFAEESYWLQKDGIIRSEFFRGVLHYEDRLLVSHKLFLGLGAVFIKLFGFGLPTLQWVGLIPFIIILAELASYIRRTEERNKKTYLLLLLILIFSNRLLIKMSFENRPELMVTALGFGSFLCITAVHKIRWHASIGGWLAALAILAHLNGVIFLLAGFGTYLYQRRYKELLYFSIVGGLTALAYFVDVIQVDNGFATWYYQFRHDPATQNAFSFYAKLKVILTFPLLFFESLEQAALSVVFIYCLWHQRAYIRQLPSILIIYSLIVLFSFWIITKHGSGTYMILFMPFMFVWLYELYRRASFLNLPLKITLIFYFIVGLFGTVELIYKNYTLGNFPTAYRQLRTKIHPRTNGVVPLTFFFNEYEQYAHLLCYENYSYQSVDAEKSSSGLAIWAYRNQADFILMDYRYNPESYYPAPGTKSLPHFVLTSFDGRFAVYQKDR